MIELRVIFQAEAIAAVGVQPGLARLPRGLGGPPEAHRRGGAGIGRAFGNARCGPPVQQAPAIDIGDKIGQRMGNALIATDRRAKLDALAGIGRGQFHRAPGHAVQLGGGEQLPFLQRGGESGAGLGPLRQHRAAGKLPAGNRQIGEVFEEILLPAGIERDNPVAIARQHDMGDGAAGHDLLRALARIEQGERDDGALARHPGQ